MIAVASATGRLFRDRGGNTLAIVAAAMLPMAGMIGSGVDMARTYMAQSRMQQACDAGALAGRRIMSGDIFNQTVKDEAAKYFNFNFPQQTYKTAAFTPSVTRPSQGVVRVQASTTIPTTIMKTFGINSLPLSVDCRASQDFVNTDIVLVLDVTGSMAWKADGSNCSGGCTTSRIAGLRSAVLALYDQLKPTQDQLAASGMRLRYGIVPYSSTVNVGKLLYAENPSYIRNPSMYWHNTTTRVCTMYFFGYCFRYEDQTTFQPTSIEHNNGWLTNWAIDNNGHDHEGCIEERDTVAFAASVTTPPAGAYDLDINLVPNSEATRWPAWDDDAQDAGNGSCPYPARRLTTWTRDNLNSYLNKLAPDGSTYHDIGMIWGGRLISDAGVFADSPKTYLNMPVNKYVIFMTDGEMAPSTSTYSAYGVEQYDKRITGGANGEQLARHNNRFSIMCDRVKELGVNIFVVSLATSLTTQMTNCASNASLATLASDNSALVDQFTEIGKKIGALRLTE